MVVLSAAVIQKNGKVLVSRQYVPMTRIRSEGLYAAFPKLVTGDAQHTFVETDQVRYVYRPFDQLYILLVTNKQSNIMEDLDTLRLLSSVVPEYCGGHTAEDVSTNCFELLFAMDEVCGGGLKESVTLDQIKTFTEMDSHEEKLQKIILESKMNEAREAARNKAKALDKQKAEMRKIQSGVKGFGSAPAQMSGGRYGGGGDSSRYGGGGGGGGGGEDSYQQEEPERTRAPPKKAAAARPKGMSLGGSKKKDDLVSQMFKEDKLTGPRTILSGGSAKGGAVAAATPMPTDKVFITVLEKLYLALERDGGVKKLDLQGELKIAVFDPDESRIIINTSGALPSEYKCRFNPKVDQKEFAASGNLQLKDTNKPFPVGSDNATVVLKWRTQTTDEDAVPFNINFWPNEEDGRSVVSVEYTLVKTDLVYKDVTLTIPCPSSEPPEISTCDGDFHYDQRERCLIWTIPEISEENDSGSLEFGVPEMDSDDFFPLHVDFSCEKTYAGLDVEGVQLAGSDAAIDYETNIGLRAEKFTID